VVAYTVTFPDNNNNGYSPGASKVSQLNAASFPAALKTTMINMTTASGNPSGLASALKSMAVGAASVAAPQVTFYLPKETPAPSPRPSAPPVEAPSIKLLATNATIGVTLGAIFLLALVFAGLYYRRYQLLHKGRKESRSNMKVGGRFAAMILAKKSMPPSASKEAGGFTLDDIYGGGGSEFSFGAEAKEEGGPQHFSSPAPSFNRSGGGAGGGRTAFNLVRLQTSTSAASLGRLRTQPVPAPVPPPAPAQPLPDLGVSSAWVRSHSDKYKRDFWKHKATGQVVWEQPADVSFLVPDDKARIGAMMSAHRASSLQQQQQQRAASASRAGSVGGRERSA
jgi:hypothetical protein